MSITCGFFNSRYSDRRYNTRQISSMFDGLIRDGVFATIGECFAAEAAGGLTVNVGTGKAWFNHTWTLNDAILPITASTSEVVLDRIDALVLEVDETEAVRNNSIKWVLGTPSSTPVNPTLVSTSEVHQYPICYIYRAAGSTEIIQANITNMVGTTETPFVTGLLETVDISTLLTQWESQFDVWFSELHDTLDSDVAGNLYNLIVSAIPLKFINTSVPVSAWEEDTSAPGGLAMYEDFLYRAPIALNGVLEPMIPEVVFGVDDACSGNYAPVCTCYAGGVYIYAAEIPDEAITIPTILVTKDVS